MFDNRNYAQASPEEREETQMILGMACLGFLALVALVVQIIGGFMIAWTVIGSIALVLFAAVWYMISITSNMRRDRF